MQPKNFKDEILRELDNSLTYMKRAVDNLKSHPEWSKEFKVMSDNCYTHAGHMYRMFLELSLDSEGQATYVNSIRDCLIESFSVKTRLIDGYKATYDLVNDSLETPVKEETDYGDNNDQ